MVKNFATKKQLGKFGEELAKKFLENKGFSILEMNYRFSKISEIDIIASKNNTLHFVEVKTRSQTNFGTPLEAIDNKKLFSIFNCAKFYMQNSKKKYKKFQIDAIGIVIDNNDIKYDFLENISL